MVEADNSAGLELVGRELVLILSEQLNDELAVQEANWTTRDQDFAAALGITYQQITLEPIPNGKLFLGHRPLLIEQPVSEYPNVTVMAFQSQPNQDFDSDHFHGLSVTMFIEIMCKAGPYDRTSVSLDAQDLVNRRTQRTTEAVVAIINRNRTLNGLVQELSGPPVINLSDVFHRTTEKGRGPRFFWQMARVEQRVARTAKAY